MRLVFASNNSHKLAEVRAMLPEGVEVLSLHEIGFEQEIDETGTTLEENSMIKAREVAAFIHDGMSASLNDGMIDGVFADDTGLEIDALGGKPGVYTARWAGEPAANRAKALRELEGKENRGAQFRTVITLITNERVNELENEGVKQVEGVVRGRIAEAEYGQGGFGYDPVFIPEGYDRTFAELPAEVKNSISHRGRAMQALSKILRTMMVVLMALFVLPIHAEKWISHLAYNHVTQIAMGAEEVYAVSNGSLFSVNKQTEQIQIYDRLSGLHGTDITCIHYDAIGKQLIIGYWTGKIDILTSRGMIYISSLYEKDMTQSKTISNITIDGRIAYLSTPYGVQTMNLEDKSLVDSYWLRPGGEETHVEDVMIANDSIYAFTSDSLFCASLHADLMNYIYWKREARSSRIQPDPNKGKHYQDANNDWYAGGSEGIVRESMADGRTYYKPQGPLENTPYRMTFAQGQLFVVPGGRWASEYANPGAVMRYEDSKWTNIAASTIAAQTGKPVKDFVNIAIDPTNSHHYFVTSYGTGLYEFLDDQCVHHYIADGVNTLGSASVSDPDNYTRVDYACFDSENRLWLLNVGNVPYPLHCLEADGTWHGVTLTFNGEPRTLSTPGGLIIDRTNSHRKWIACARTAKMGLYLLDDNGTPWDTSDDRVQFYNAWTDQHGRTFDPSFIYDIMQDDLGRLWIATEKGAAYIDPESDYFTSDAVVRPEVMDENGENPVTSLSIKALCQTMDGRIWLGTENIGAYALNPELTQISAQYTTGNSAFPSNGILSLVAGEDDNIFFGTGSGLVEFKYKSGGGQGIPWDKDSIVSLGTMKNWKTYFSYNNISAIEDAGDKAYCIAEGALLGVNKSNEEMIALSKLTGLTGSDVRLTTYNKETGKTLIVYQNGQIDIIYPNGDVKSMLDVFMTTETRPTEFYSSYSHGNRIYLCSSLGVININMSKNEVAETYVLLDDSEKELSVRHICIVDDKIYAGTDTRIYTAKLGDNLVDYAVWKRMAPNFVNGIRAMGSKDSLLYVHHDYTLFCYRNTWRDILKDRKWDKLFIHPQSVIAQTRDGLLFEVMGEESKQLNIPYAPTDILRNGQDYWLAVAAEGLIKWNSSTGTQQFALNSPCVNMAYRLRTTNEKLIMLPGGYFADNYFNDANVMVLEDGFWRNYTHKQWIEIEKIPLYDFCDAAVDPADPSHFFVASFGYGLLEFRGNEFYTRYLPSITPNGLESVLAEENLYTRVDGLMFDANSNLWMLNNSYNGVKVLLKSGQWVRISNIATRSYKRTKDLLIWNQDPNIKILTCARTTPGVGVFNDNGTITDPSDDKAVFVSTFYDQNEKAITPQFVYSICQMANGEVWVGTEAGLFIIPDVRNLLNHDYHCRRIIIPRNDGTGLGDYLLGEEKINAIAEDAAGRKWIGTETSGLYLVSDDGLETIEHFIKYNSPLISDGIYAIAIQPKTGEVFIGTSIGLLSYQSDANEAKEDMSNIYAYPNPVRPNYQGYISITGLMDNTEVRIIDGGGNLICKTRSNGGLAIWDGKDGNGKRATPGVYTAVCNADGGHNVVKIMLIR